MPRLALDNGAAVIKTRNLLIASPVPYRYATKLFNRTQAMTIQYLKQPECV